MVDLGDGPSLRSPAATRAVAEPVDENVRALETLVSYRIGLLAKVLDRRLALLVARYGLATAEYRVLAQITLRPGSTVRGISARTRVDKAQVSRTIAALERRDLVERVIPLNDRRSPVLTATPTGRRLIEVIAPLRKAQDEQVLAGMTADDVQQLKDALDQLFEKLMKTRESEDGAALGR